MSCSVYIAPVFIFNTYSLHSKCQGGYCATIFLPACCFSLFFFCIFFSIFCCLILLDHLIFLIYGVSKTALQCLYTNFLFLNIVLCNCRLLVATRTYVLFKLLTPLALINSQLCKGYQ